MTPNELKLYNFNQKMSLDSLPHDLLFVLEEYIGASGSHILRSCSTIFTIYKPAYPLHDILANNYFYLFSYLNEIGYQMNESELPKLAIRHNNLGRNVSLPILRLSRMLLTMVRWKYFRSMQNIVKSFAIHQ
jgi:hypothetical protein